MVLTQGLLFILLLLTLLLLTLLLTLLLLTLLSGICGEVIGIVRIRLQGVGNLRCQARLWMTRSCWTRQWLLSRSWFRLVVSHLRRQTEVAVHQAVEYLLDWAHCGVQTVVDHTLCNFGLKYPCGSSWRVYLPCNPVAMSNCLP